MTPRQPKIERILVPTDYSPCADQAFAWAILHARRFGAALTILHVIEHHIHLAPAGGGDSLHPGDVDRARAELEAYVAKHLAGEGLRVECVVEVGEPPLKIREIARRCGADVIVMGTHGRSRLADMLTGSVVEKVVHHSGCPVLAVPPIAEPT